MKGKRDLTNLRGHGHDKVSKKNLRGGPVRVGRISGRGIGQNSEKRRHQESVEKVR